MEKTFAKLRLFAVSLSIIGGLFYLAREFIFNVFSPSMTYEGRSVESQAVIIIALLGVAAILSLVIDRCFGKSRPLDKPLQLSSSVEYALGLFVLGILMIYLLNNVFNQFNFELWEYQPFREPYGTTDVIGSDYRLGIYIPAHNLMQLGNPYLEIDGIVLAVYPPLMYFVFTPLALLSEQAGYMIIVILSTLSVFGSLLMTALIIHRYLKVNTLYIWVVSILIALLVFSSSFFHLAIDRGNIDAIMYFLMLLTIYLMINQPKTFWLQVIILSIASQVKVFPVLLFPLLLLYHGKKLLLPAFLTNAVLALCLGPTVLLSYLNTMTVWPVERYFWWGNHSAASLLFMLEGIYPGLARNHTIFYWVLFSFPLLLSGFIAFYIHRFVKSDIKWLMQFILLTFLMCLLPSVSHDYKLVILSSGLVLYSLFFVLWLGAGLNVKNLLFFGLFLLTLLVFHRPFSYITDSYLIFKSNYLALVLILIEHFLILPGTEIGKTFTVASEG